MKMSGYLRLLAAGWLSAMILLASEHHGQVTFGGLPVPGVAVTATMGDNKATAITDGMGTYTFPDLADGTWNLQVEMSGFTTLKQDVGVGPGVPGVTFELKLKSLSEIQAQVQAPVLAEARPPGTPAPPKPAAPKPPAPAKPKPGVQTAAAGGSAPAPAGAAAGGRGGAPAAAAEPAPSEASQQAADGFLVNGSQVNGGASPFALNPAFGNNRRGPRSLYTYLLQLNVGNSALNANSYSLNGAHTPKAAYNNITGQGSVQGPLRIPHILRNGPTFFINYSLNRTRNANNAEGLVPTAAQEKGDLSNVTTPIIDPTTLLPFQGNIIPMNRISPQATALLAYFPAPNFTSSTYNFQRPVVGVSHGDFVNTRLQKQIGRKNSILGTFAFQSTRSSNPNGSGFPFLDTNSGLGMRINPQWRHQFTPRLSTTLQYDFTRNAQHVYSFFENHTNVSGLAGITGNNQSPTYWGPPNLNFGSSGIQGMSDGVPSFIRPQTGTARLDSTWNHGRHTVSFSADFIQQQFNYFNQTNPRGNFSFTGAATAATPGGGSPFADFLLGIPDTATLAFGNADKYLRASNYDASIQDDWRVNSALTVNGGVHWGDQEPVTEKYGRLVNLDIAPGFTAAEPVCSQSLSTPTGPCVGPVGAQTGLSYPSSLVHPERHTFEPGVGLAWRPISGSSLVVRAGYSLRYSTSIYQNLATQMYQQAPLSTSLQVANSAANPLTLANGFVGSPSSEATTNAIDPNFKIGYAQTWTLTIQKDLPAGMQMQANYTGIKGTRMPQIFYPNSWAPGGVNPCPSCPVGFQYESSNGNSTRNSGSIQLRRRLHNGFTAQVQYTYSKSIDDLPSGQAQNWLDLSGERGLSSFDQRQLVAAQLQYTSGMGIGGGSLLSGWRGAVLKEWTFVIPIQWGTGLPENPNYLGGVLGGTAFSGPLRPEFTGANLYAAKPGLFLNPDAFAAPAPGTFGNFGKDSITGPYRFSLNASMQRTFRVSDRVTLNLRVDATNALNHVTFSSYNVNYSAYSPQLGAAAGANQMRQMTTTAQFRF
jgi:hypothetical protein